MNKIFKKILSSNIIGTVIIIALGLILTFFPSMVANTICYFLGVICLLACGFYLYKCIKTQYKTVNAFTFLAYLALGLILIIFKSHIFAALPLTAGICLFVFSLLKLYTAFCYFHVNKELFKKLIVPSVINAVLGLLLILLRDLADDIIIRIIGVILLYCACEGIVTNLLIRADGKSSTDTEKKHIIAEVTDSDTSDD